MDFLSLDYPWMASKIECGSSCIVGLRSRSVISVSSNLFSAILS